ncbi:MAG: hypothetical protein AAB325_08550 [Pseudomonadota bacterium]
MSEATFDELEDVLHRPGIRAVRIRDPKDKPFVELAASLPAADFIVTGDKDFTESRYGDVPVISARDFVDKVLRR